MDSSERPSTVSPAEKSRPAGFAFSQPSLLGGPRTLRSVYRELSTRQFGGLAHTFVRIQRRYSGDGPCSRRPIPEWLLKQLRKY